MDFKKNLADRIRSLMTEKKVSSAYLAGEIGLNKVSVSNILTGKSSPTIENLIKIARVLNVKPSIFIDEESEAIIAIGGTSIRCPHCQREIALKVEVASAQTTQQDEVLGRREEN